MAKRLRVRWVRITADMRLALVDFVNVLKVRRDRSFDLILGNRPYSKVIFTDASHKGIGGFTPGFFFSEPWEKIPVEFRKHINYTELFAALSALKIWIPRFRGENVVLLTDSKTALHWLMKLRLDRKKIWVHIREIAFLLEQCNAGLVVQHISGSENSIADSLSRNWVGTPEFVFAAVSFKKVAL